MGTQAGGLTEGGQSGCVGGDVAGCQADGRGARQVWTTTKQFDLLQQAQGYSYPRVIGPEVALQVCAGNST